MKYSADDVLLEREKRVEFLNKVMERFNMPLIFMRVNYPGLNKDNTLSNNIIQNVDKVVTDIFEAKLHMKLFRITAEGPTLIHVINEEALKIKNLAVEVENKYTLGRCVDIDIYDNLTRQAISRRDLGLESRKCYICDDLAHNCVRTKRHSENEVIKYMYDTYKEFMENFYGKKL
jgi:holo-ACP synthase